MTDPRDEALSWEGDDDPTMRSGGADPGRASREAERNALSTRLPKGWAAVGRGSTPGSGDVLPHAADAAPATEAAAAPHGDRPLSDAPLGNAALVSVGVLGGVHLLYAVGWLIGGLRLQGRYQVLVTDAMYQGALWVATAAPLIWFGTMLIATRGARSWVRWVWLAVGVVLLVPWPFIMIGAVGI